ncbi:MAG: HDOD domain-containing protein [Deltaproteobacteria bacterium]|nr:HDOD domain-containing protein [Deltaproteobacteria bacterium]
MFAERSQPDIPLIDRIVSSKDLPTLPGLLIKLIEICNLEDTSFRDVAEIIEKDPSLCSKVLKLVNSAYTGLYRNVESIESGILVLGMDAIKNIAVSTGVYQAFKRLDGNATFNLKAFWWHSLMCAVTARLIANRVRYGAPEDAFLSGLVHDLGKLAIWANCPQEYSSILETAGGDPEALLSEEEALGGAHTVVGSWLLHQWKLPTFMADAVLYHHELPKRILHSLPLVRIIFLANLISTPATSLEKKLKVAKELFGFSSSDVEALFSKAEKEVVDVAGSMEIEIEADKGLADRDSKQDLDQAKTMARKIRDISLLYGTARHFLEAHSETEILRVARQGLQILFDVHDLFLFIYDESTNLLVGADGREGRENLKFDLVVPFEEQTSLPAKCLASRRPTDSFSPENETSATIADEQLIRATGREGILCLPMTAHKKPVGAIVLGVNRSEFGRLSERTNLLNMFACQAAAAVYAYQLREAQSQLVQTERLAAATAVARRVVHEANNPLGIIKNYLQILRTKFDEEHPAHEDLRIIKDEIDRVVQIIGQLSDFSAVRRPHKDQVDLNSLLADLARLTGESLKQLRNIGLELDLDPSLPVMRSDKAALKQVFINLMKNAVEAVSAGGNISIRTRCVPPRSEIIADRLEDSYPIYAEITFADNGPGVPDELKARIFEPYVTTKSKGHGGLGLSIVHNLVSELKGAIRFESDKETGTTFKILLPIPKG